MVLGIAGALRLISRRRPRRAEISAAGGAEARRTACTSRAMRKVRAELRDELRKEKPDKQRARTLFAKELDLRQEFREKGFRNCIENHDHSKGRCGWIARHDRRMGYGNGAWVKFIDELSKDKPNKVRAWEYFSEAEKINRELAMERFDAMLDDPDGWRGWYCSPRDGPSAPATDGTARDTAGARGRGTDAGLRVTTGAAGTSVTDAARTAGTAARVTGTDLPTRRRENI